MTREIVVECPSCSPKEEVPHEVLKEGQSPVVRCLECGQVHSAKLEKRKTANIKAIVSRKDESVTCRTELDSETVLYVDDEIVVDDEETGMVCPILISSIEVGEKRVDSARAEEINTVWGRAIDEITIKFSVQSGVEKTEALEKVVPGDKEFTVGEEEKVGDTWVTITKIKVRDGAFRSRKGDVMAAKYVKRIFARKRGNRAWKRDSGRGPW
jgi:uncharacterized Zn finger protein